MSTTLGQKEIAETAIKENSRIVEKVSDNQFENNRYMLIVLFVLIGIVYIFQLYIVFVIIPLFFGEANMDHKSPSEVSEIIRKEIMDFAASCEWTQEQFFHFLLSYVTFPGHVLGMPFRDWFLEDYLPSIVNRNQD